MIRYWNSSPVVDTGESKEGPRRVQGGSEGSPKRVQGRSKESPRRVQEGGIERVQGVQLYNYYISKRWMQMAEINIGT